MEPGQTMVLRSTTRCSSPLPAGKTPFQFFAGAVGGFFTMFGLPQNVSVAIMTMCVSALAMTTIDSVARIGRMSLQELFVPSEGEKQGVFMSAIGGIVANNYVATALTLVLSYALCLAGYYLVFSVEELRVG